MNRRNSLRLARLVILSLSGFVCLLTTAAGCARVQPYEREHLANPIMLIDQTSGDAFDQHMYDSLEQGTGQPQGGAGCGCTE